MLPPFFYKSPSDDGLFAYFSEALNRIGEGPAVYLYNFPQQSAVPFSLELTARLIRAFPGAVRGMKDSSGDFAYTSSVARAFAPDGFEVYCGDDSALHYLLALGGAGCITAAANIGADLSARVFAHRGAAEGAAAQASLTTLRRAVSSAPLIPGLKALTARRTGDPAWTAMRPPHLPLGPEAEAALFAAYDAARA
jgi:4-hydroxy-tetrahydrodipicolinate synthase